MNLVEIFDLSLAIMLGIFFAFVLIHISVDIIHGDKIFEIYQRFGWLQEDTQKLATKEDEN